MGGSSTRSSSLEDTSSTRNTIEVILDSYLEANPNIDAVVVSWDVIFAAWSLSERNELAPEFNFTPIQIDGHGKPSARNAR